MAVSARHDRPPPGVRDGGDGRSAPAPSFRGGTACGAAFRCARSAIGGIRRPGFVEADLVAHCGSLMAGSFVWTLVLTDIASGWTECVPLLVREAGVVVDAVDRLRGALPFPLRGVDTDNSWASCHWYSRVVEVQYASKTPLARSAPEASGSPRLQPSASGRR